MGVVKKTEEKPVEDVIYIQEEQIPEAPQKVQVPTEEVVIVPEVKKTEETPFLPDEEIAPQKEPSQEEVVVPEVKKIEEQPVEEIKEEEVPIEEEQMPEAPQVVQIATDEVMIVP